MNFKLDKEQDACVHTDSKKVLVIAGAGSGKTRVLTERIKFLIEEKKVNPASIVAITFTNLAAEEMRSRLNDVKGISTAFIGTIHSFANHIMAKSGEKYNLFTEDLDRNFHTYLINTYCKALTIERYAQYCKAQVDYELGKISQRILKNFFNQEEQYELALIHRDEEEILIQNVENKKLPKESIQTLCKQNNVITFDELIEKAEKYFRSINASIDYLLVDEFQDVGRLEYNFFKALNPSNIFYVGDDYQSIYSFKGGDVRLFKNLVRSEDFKTFILTNNYRSAEQILDEAEIVAQQIKDRIPKPFHAINKNVGRVDYERKNYLPYVLKSISPSCYKNYFILTRTNADLHKIMELCDKMNIPCESFKRDGLRIENLKTIMNKNTVKILTVHTSKGLENENVILYGNFPLYQKRYNKDEDERRVMYVGMTRAKNHLWVLT